MRHYEILFFVHPDQSTQVPSMVERYQNMVTESGGIIYRCEDWGRRRLAHPVLKIYKAHYVLLNIECDQQVIASLQHAFRFNDAVLRHLIVYVPKAETAPSPVMKKISDELEPENVTDPSEEKGASSDTSQTTVLNDTKSPALSEDGATSDRREPVQPQDNSEESEVV